MRLAVDHTTIYRYDAPVRGVVQSHRLTPTRCEGQSVIDWAITVSDGTPGGAFRDGSGDWVQGFTIPGPVSEISVRVTGTVETRDTQGVLRGNRERVPPAAWMLDTLLTEPSQAIHDLAADVPQGEALTRAHDLARAVTAAVRYDPGVTDAQTTAAQALQAGAGVCQDHAHVMIAAAHLLDLPARYVSGYLHATQDGTPHEAAHAWAEIHVEGLGWVGFDAANACCPDERYIRLGCGLDARHAAPIRGIARGDAQESMEIAVAVVAAQQ